MTLTPYNAGIYSTYGAATCKNTEFRYWSELEDAITRVGIVVFENCDFVSIDARSRVLGRKWGTVDFRDCGFTDVNFTGVQIQEDFHFKKCEFKMCDFSQAHWGQDLWVQNCQFSNCVNENHFQQAASVFTLASVPTGSWTLISGAPGLGSWTLSNVSVSGAWPWTIPEYEVEPDKKKEDLYGPDDCRKCGHTGVKRKMCMWCTHCNSIIWGC